MHFSNQYRRFSQTRTYSQKKAKAFYLQQKSIHITFKQFIINSVCGICFLFLLTNCVSNKPQNEAITAQPVAVPQDKSQPIAIQHLDTKKALTKIAFGSCSQQKLPQPIWTTILATNPDFYISMGDMVYASRPTEKPIAEQYRLQSLVPEFRQFRSQKPVIGIWDDNDYGEGDGGNDNKDFNEARQAYLDFFIDDAGYITRSQKGIYHSIMFGPEGKRVQIILPDLRTYRSALEKNQDSSKTNWLYQPTADKNKTMLGEAQWRWLIKEIKKPAEIKIFVSGVQFIAEDHGFEKWGLFPHEKQKLLDIIKSLKPKNFYIISGDRHFSEISKLAVPEFGDLYDITSSAINRNVAERKEPNQYRVGPTYFANNFGTINIDWNLKKIRFDITGLDGTVVNSLEKPLTDIK